MKYFFLPLIILALLPALLAAGEIAIISTFDGTASLIRNDTNNKFKIGDRMESGDELQTLEKTSAGFKFIDGYASLRLFSDSKLMASAKQDESGLIKRVTLAKGSSLTRVYAHPETFTFLTYNCVINPDSSAFLVRVFYTGETCLSVLSGAVKLTVPASQTTQMITQGQTAFIKTNGEMLIRETLNTDFTEQEIELISPFAPPLNKNLTLPMVDKHGNVKLIRFNW